MSDSEEPSTEPTSERVVLFTDAVSAIAITLLVLPLVDIVPEASHQSLGHLIEDHLGQFGAFILSFAVIFRLWWAHHQLFRHVTLIDWKLVRWSVLWTFAIVFMPLPTAIVTAYSPSAATVGLYGGTLVLAEGSLLIIAIVLHRTPRYSRGSSLESREEVLGAATAFGGIVLAIIVGCVFASTINFYAFLLLFLTGNVQRVIEARWRRKDAERDAERIAD